MQPANQRGRRSWRNALRQYPQLLLKAPAPPPLRAGENLAANLPSPRMSTPEALPFDQPRVIHCVAASKDGSIQLNTPSARRPSADAYLDPPLRQGGSACIGTDDLYRHPPRGSSFDPGIHRGGNGRVQGPRLSG